MCNCRPPGGEVDLLSSKTQLYTYCRIAIWGVGVNFPTAIEACFRKYVDFNGRASRSEFWYFFLFAAIVGLVALVLDEASGSDGLWYALAVLGLLLPNLAVQVRRLHDTDRSGWWVLIGLIPIVGPILLIIWDCQMGDLEANRFGAAPAFEVENSGSPVSTSRQNNLDDLEKLFALHEKGVLTKEEFEAQKAAILR